MGHYCCKTCGQRYDACKCGLPRATSQKGPAMKQTQYDRIASLITRKKGATALEMMQATASTCVHKRMSELRSRGWSIYSKPVEGRNFSRYFGIPPAEFS